MNEEQRLSTVRDIRNVIFLAITIFWPLHGLMLILTSCLLGWGIKTYSLAGGRPPKNFALKGHAPTPTPPSIWRRDVLELVGLRRNRPPGLIRRAIARQNENPSLWKALLLAYIVIAILLVIFTAIGVYDPV